MQVCCNVVAETVGALLVEVGEAARAEAQVGIGVCCDAWTLGDTVRILSSWGSRKSTYKVKDEWSSLGNTEQAGTLED